MVFMLRPQGKKYGENVGSEEINYGSQGSQVQDGVEKHPGLVEARYVTLGDDKVGRTADGKQFRQTLNDAEENGLKHGHGDSPVLA
jgi:hypothetical protein